MCGVLGSGGDLDDILEIGAMGAYFFVPALVGLSVGTLYYVKHQERLRKKYSHTWSTIKFVIGGPTLIGMIVGAFLCDKFW